MAARALRLGHHKHALVVGVELANRTSLSGFCGLQLVAPELKPFDLERSGIVLGEGIGAVLLTACDGTAPGLYLRAEASNCDIYSVTTANPDGTSIAAVQRLALGQAGIAAAQVAGIKSHGTASPMNDTGEAAGIRQVFEAPPPICALKPFTGHTLGACGVNELALFSLALNAGFFPATRGFKTPDPALGLSPSLEALPASDGHYLLNYFGFGGNNSSLILERRS
jgi:3-oxoacyl-[acyl-carrier-protein] synthase-1